MVLAEIPELIAQLFTTVLMVPLFFVMMELVKMLEVFSETKATLFVHKL
jgi:hypothetical protein